MSQADSTSIKWLPRSLRSYILYGTDVRDSQLRRRRLVRNVLSLAVMQTVITYCAVFLWIDPVGLWPPAASLACYLPILLWPFANGKYELLTGTTAAFGSIIIQTVTTALLGISSGTHMFIFVPVTVGVFVIGARHRAILGLLTLAGVLSICACAIWFREPMEFVRLTPDLELTLSVISVTSVLLFVSIFTYFAFLTAERAEKMLAAEHARSEELLKALLPAEIADRLKQFPDAVIADSLPNVAILFADIVDFTTRAASLPPEEVVSILNKVFRAFDELAEKHGLEKIKTIGDAYMVAAGMPDPCSDPAHRIAEMALDMQQAVAALSDEIPQGLSIRIGLHAGPAVAGVIGNRKPFYDVWGETVNTASRMESHAEPGRIQVSGAAREELLGDYAFEERGTVEVKGMGSVETWWLTGRMKPVADLLV